MGRRAQCPPSIRRMQVSRRVGLESWCVPSTYLAAVRGRSRAGSGAENFRGQMADAHLSPLEAALASGMSTVALPTDQSDEQLLPLLHVIKAMTLSPAMLRALASRLNELASDVESSNSFTTPALPPVPALPVAPSVPWKNTVATVEMQSCSSAEARNAGATMRPADAPRVRGVITRWICEGYGFVVHDGRTIFLHEDEFDSSVPKRAGRSTALPPGEGPKAGDHVEFEVTTNAKGFYGKNIKIVFVADIADCTLKLVESGCAPW